MESTQNWIFLVVEKGDKKQLLALIKSFDVPEKQKNEWRHVLEELWTKYPITLDDNTIQPDLPLKKGKKSITLTKEEIKVLGDVYDAIAAQMNTEGVVPDTADIITPQWRVAQHNAIITLAAEQENVPEYYAKIAGDSSGKPDDVGFPIQQVTHYFNPDLLTGMAHIGCQIYADTALNDYRNRHWDDAFIQWDIAAIFLRMWEIPCTPGPN